MNRYFNAVRRHGADILASPGMRSERNFTQHGRVSVFRHSLGVAMLCVKLSRALRQALGVSLFGIDIIINNQTGQHAVIDINAFPGEPWGRGLPSPAWRLVAVGG